MIVLLIRRLLQLVPVLIAISMVTFFMLHLTGDPAIVILGPEASPEAVDRLRVELGLNDPLLTQFSRYFVAAVQGDFGLSTRFRQPALGLFMERIPATLELAGAALLVSIVFGVTLGVASAVYHRTPLDSLVRFAALVGQAVPGFFLGIIGIIVFAAQLNWLPSGGRGSVSHLVMPALSLGAFYSATISRFVRGAMLEVLSADFVRTARSKGLPGRAVIFGHALRNALIGVVTLIGLQTGSLLSGAVVTETVFSWPGVGRMAVQAIYTRDFPLVQVTILMTAVLFVVINLITDALYGLIDPRIRVGGGR